MTRPVLRPLREIRSWPPPVKGNGAVLPWWLWAVAVVFLALCGWSIARGCGS